MSSFYVPLDLDFAPISYVKLDLPIGLIIVTLVPGACVVSHNYVKTVGSFKGLCSREWTLHPIFR